MVKKVGLLTFHNAYNFGAVLQAFALQRTIQSMGYSCSIIDYARPLQGSGYQLFVFPKKIGHMIYDLRVLSNLRSHFTLRKRFATFSGQHLTLTPRSYRSARDLRRDYPEFEVFVVGSDQVWHPHMLDNETAPIFYLDFVASGRRVAYAPSFGLSEIPKPCHERAAAFIRGFDFLSAREDSGCRIIHELTGRKADYVLDPTLLLSAVEYDKVAVGPAKSEPCVLLYPMEMSKSLNDLARSIRARLKLPLVAVVPIYFNPRKFRFADQVVFDAGPAEFLGWMRKAAFVCTNSFHGVAFSVIHRKTFLCVTHSVANTRIHSLLNRIGLTRRQITNPSDSLPGDSLFAPMDYSSIEPCLQNGIDASLDYLKRALA